MQKEFKEQTDNWRQDYEKNYISITDPYTLFWNDGV